MDFQIFNGNKSTRGLDNLHYETRDHLVEQLCTVPTQNVLLWGFVCNKKFELDAKHSSAAEQAIQRGVPVVLFQELDHLCLHLNSY